MNLYAHAAHALNSHRNLPATRVLGAHPNLGATRPRGNRVPPVFADVEGAPSIKMRREADNSVTTSIHLNSRYADFMTRADLAFLQKEADEAVKQARALSRGGLSLRELRRRGHPYGLGLKNGRRRAGLGRLRGARAGISNRAVVNKQSGDFERSWGAKASLHKSGGAVSLYSSSPVSGYLAFGTTKMRAHYPAPTVLARRKQVIMREWRKAARAAWARELAMQGLQGERAPVAL